MANGGSVTAGGTRYLILNADDFGASARVNAAVWKAHHEGVLTSASLMVAEEGCAEAVEMAKAMPALGVGLHLVVTADRALLPASALPHLVDSEGRFGDDPLRVGLRYTFSKAARAELRLEMEAQFARFAETGLPWSHVDGHQHFHTPPVVWNHLLDLCERYGIYRLRLPSEEIRPHLRGGGLGPDINVVAAVIFRLLRRRNLRLLRTRAVRSGKPFFVCDRVYGLLQTGRMETDYILRLLGRLGGTTNEIYFHPGAKHACLLPPEQQTDTVRDVELRALLAPAIRERITALGLQCGNYAQVEAARASSATR